MKKSAEKCRFLLNKGGESVNDGINPNDIFNNLNNIDNLIVCQKENIFTNQKYQKRLLLF